MSARSSRHPYPSYSRRRDCGRCPEGVRYVLSPPRYRHASICGNHRVVFNIGGNKYRLVVEMQYRAGIAWVKFIGIHARYDEIDVETVSQLPRPEGWSL
ncbi:type II toxin-antitoxin system HigB family toxin [Allochromatium palmeri]|uniref:Type II toxin-antitoxin system HigB family toxin n=1 Tax=Allochromatium palmeri TaxID=231048 RepID=A0A6N8EE81_9GAMM|nr:type II toxin-antitoxin system HigB family toxin [Allochromatium palmeri]MTW22543.1 hypothetical protein [Allochromatium palmeri]